MKVKITNEDFSVIGIYYNGKMHRLRQNEYVYLDAIGDTIDLHVRKLTKSAVHLDWADILSGIFFGNSTSTFINCDYFCTVKGGEYCEVIMQPNSEDRARVEYSSVCAQALGGEVLCEHYETGDLKKIKRKFRRLQFFFTSGFIFYLLTVILCAVLNDWDNMLFSFFIFLFCTLPSVVQSIKYRKKTDLEYINSVLTDRADELRKADFDILKVEPKDKTEKLLKKVIVKMFKLEDE